MWSYENEQKRLQQLLEEVDCNESLVDLPCDDKSDSDDSDHEEIEIHESESEQDISEAESEQNDIVIGNHLSFMGKF